MVSLERQRPGRFIPANDKQKRFIESIKKNVMLSGAVAAGKSYLGCTKGFLLNIKYPGNRGLICRKEAKSLYSSTLKTLLEQVIPPEMIVSFNQMKGEIVHQTTIPGVYSTIVLSGLDKKADQTYPTKIGSTEYGWIFVDEGVELDEGDWMMLNTRLRFKIPGFSNEQNDIIPRQIFTGTNPDSPYHWLYKYFFENDSPDREVILTTPYENPYLPKSYLESLENNLFGVARERLLYGKWVQAEGVIYNDFDPAIHVIDDSGLLAWHDYKGFLAGADSNFPLPRACVLLGIRGGGRFDVIDEFYKENAYVEEMISWLEEKAKEFKNSIMVFHDPSDPQAIDKINNSSFLSCSKAKNSVVPGISAVAYKFKNKQLFIHKCCFNLIREINGYHWVKGKESDKPFKSMDHAVDSVRYAIYSQDAPTGFSIGRFIS